MQKLKLSFFRIMFISLKAANAYGNSILKKKGFIDVKSLVDAGIEASIACNDTTTLVASTNYRQGQVSLKIVVGR